MPLTMEITFIRRPKRGYWFHSLGAFLIVISMIINCSGPTSMEMVRISSPFQFRITNGVTGLDDYVFVKNNSFIGVRLNLGLANDSPAFGDYAEVPQDISVMYCLLRGVRFGDINADGMI